MGRGGMTEEEIKTMGEHLARLDEATSFIKDTSKRQEKALIDIFKSNKEMTAKITGLETVIRMSIAEQKRINERADEDLSKIKEGWDTKEGELDTRMRSTERRISWFAGGAAVALLVFDIVFRFIIMWVKAKIS